MGGVEGPVEAREGEVPRALVGEGRLDFLVGEALVVELNERAEA